MPLVITESLVLSGSDAAGIPLTHARILYDDVVGQGSPTLTASSEATGFEKENAADYLTHDFWKAASLPATLEVQSAQSHQIDFAMVVAHSLGTDGAAVKFQYHNGAGWVDLTAEVAPGTDEALAFLFEQVTTSRIRLSVTGDGDPPSIGVVMAGKALAMERGVTLTHTPLNLAGRTRFSNNDSESGQWLGRSIRRNGFAAGIAFANITETFIRNSFQPFIVAARSRPFGWLWAPVEFPADVVYCRCDEDIKPGYAGLQDRMNVEFNVIGFVG